MSRIGLRDRPLEQELGLDPCHHDREVERLGHVVVGAQPQGMDDLLALVPRRRHDHRQLGRRMPLAEDLEDLQAAETGHHDVEQDQVERPIRDQGECAGAVGADGDAVPLALEPAREHVAVQLVVVDDEQRARLGRHEPLLAAPAPPCDRTGSKGRKIRALVTVCPEQFECQGLLRPDFTLPAIRSRRRQSRPICMIHDGPLILCTWTIVLMESGSQTADPRDRRRLACRVAGSSRSVAMGKELPSDIAF